MAIYEKKLNSQSSMRSLKESTDATYAKCDNTFKVTGIADDVNMW